MTSPLSPEAVAQMVADREAGTPGPWQYRPDQYDDWGVVKSGGCVICQARDPARLGRSVLAECRENGTDPWEANARRIARLPDLEAAYLTLAAENATLQRDYDRATVTAAQFMADAVQRLETAERANATLRASEAAAMERVRVLERECRLTQAQVDRMLVNSTKMDANITTLTEAAARVLHDIDDIVANSEGVAGLHMNGEVAEWHSLMSGGSFEAWLRSVEVLRAALTPTADKEPKT